MVDAQMSLRTVFVSRSRANIICAMHHWLIPCVQTGETQQGSMS